MIRDPLVEVLDASRRADAGATGPGDVDPTDLAGVRLARRRFGVALPPPFVEVAGDPSSVPIRRAGSLDGAAIAAVQRRAWRVSYRGFLTDRFLDDLDFSYLGGYWSGRSAVDPTPRHRLYVAGRPGEVHGVVDTGPTRDPDAEVGPDGLPRRGEVRSLYVDPARHGLGLGSRLLAVAVASLAEGGAPDAMLWVVEGNAAARGFYEGRGWRADGGRATTAVGDGGTLEEVRYVLPGPLGGS